MLNTKTYRSSALLAALALSTSLTLAAPTLADDTGISISGNVSIVNDYRFRGVSLSGEDTALQGGLDLNHESGFYIGTWGSSIDQFEGSELELDIYGGYAGEAGGIAFDVGVLAYTYPGSNGTTYIEGYGSVSGAMEDFGWTAGVAYAWDQGNLGDEDNLYLYLDAEHPLGETGITLDAHVAYEDGALSWRDDKIDWSLGGSYDLGGLEIGVHYVDTNFKDTLGDATLVVSLGASF